METPIQRKGIIAWFAYNPVAANLLMLIIITVGLFFPLHRSITFFCRPSFRPVVLPVPLVSQRPYASVRVLAIRIRPGPDVLVLSVPPPTNLASRLLSLLAWSPPPHPR